MLGPRLRFVERTKVLFEGRRYTFFGGNDYHRLSSHPEVVRAAAEAAAAEGLGSAGSRVTTGNHPLYEALERAIARFAGSEAALTVASGYLANLALLEAAGKSFGRFFVDESAHSSVLEACLRLPRDRVHRFRHLDPDDLARLVRSELRAGERPLVLTDGVFPSRGEIAPLDAYAAAVRGLGGALVVDDAHAIGVIGRTGKGTWEERGLGRGDRLESGGGLLQTGTLSKALGAFGGFVAAGAETAARVVEESLVFSGATGIPLPLAAAAVRSIEILEREPERIARLRERTLSWKGRIAALGYPVEPTPVPIVSIVPIEERAREALRSSLFRRGVYPPYISYPGAPAGGHFRFTFSSGHTEEEFEALAAALGDAPPGASAAGRAR